MTTETNSGSCCGSGSCGSGATVDVQDVGVTTVYKVSGMTCGHCEGAVSQEISALDGVTAVTAVATSGEVSVTSAARSTRRPSAPPSTRQATNSSAEPDEAFGATPAPDTRIPPAPGRIAPLIRTPYVPACPWRHA